MFFGLFFWYSNWMPLYHSDLWGHVLYGEWILEQCALPATEPFVPLAMTTPIIDTAWLSQLVFALVERAGGADGLSHLYALTTLATFAILARVFYLQTRRLSWAVLGVSGAGLIAWGRLAFFRPETLGVLCFAVLIWSVAVSNPRRGAKRRAGPPARQAWIVIPLVFVAWANLHGTFAVGLVFLGCFVVGESIGAYWRAGRRFSALASPELCRWWLLLVGAGIATLLNPYGYRLLLETARFSQNPNLQYVTEWFPLDFSSNAGLRVVSSWVLLAVLLGVRWRRFTATDLILLAAFSFAVCFRIRFLNWYAGVAVFVLLPHLQRALARFRGGRGTSPTVRSPAAISPASFRYTLLTVLAVWSCLAMSPLGRQLLAGRSRPDRQLYSLETPLKIARYLHERPASGMTFCPHTWGDWLIWDGPQGLQVLVTTTSLHVVSPSLWRDYLSIADGVPEWDTLLQRYHVQCLVVSKATQPVLWRRVRECSRWRITFEDDLGAVAVRVSTSGDSWRQPCATVGAARHPFLGNEPSLEPLPRRNPQELAEKDVVCTECVCDGSLGMLDAKEWTRLASQIRCVCRLVVDPSGLVSVCFFFGRTVS